MDENFIRENIKALESTIAFLKNLLDDEKNKDYLFEFTKLRGLVRSSDWPLAVPQSIFEENEEQTATRTINELIKFNIKDKKFLDYECKEGFIPYVAEKLGANSIGFDSNQQDWSHFTFSEKFTLTDNIELVKNSAPFDIILINDVLNYSENPEEILKTTKELLSENGEIFLRIHPWTSRFAFNYKKLNKAYLHLIFGEHELYKIGIKPPKTFNKADSVNYYKSIIKKLDLKIKEENIITQNIEIFFTHQKFLMERIKENYKKITIDDLNKKMLETQYVDLILQK